MKIRNLIQKEFRIANQPPPKDKADYKAKMSTIQDLQKNPKLRDPESQANIMKRKAELDTWAKKNLKKENSTEAAGDMDLIGDGAKNLGLDPNKFDYYYDTSGAGYGEVRTKKSGKTILQFEYDRDGDAEVSMDNKTVANIKQGEQLPINVISKLNMMKEDDNSDIDIRKLLVDISSMKDRISELAMDDGTKTSALTALGKVEDDIAQEIKGSFPEDVDVDAQFKSDVLQFLNSKVVQIEKQIELAPAKTPEEKENKEFALKLFNFVQAKLEQKDNGDNTITVPKSFKKD